MPSLMAKSARLGLPARYAASTSPTTWCRKTANPILSAPTSGGRPRQNHKTYESIEPNRYQTVPSVAERIIPDNRRQALAERTVLTAIASLFRDFALHQCAIRLPIPKAGVFDRNNLSSLGPNPKEMKRNDKMQVLRCRLFSTISRFGKIAHLCNFCLTIGAVMAMISSCGPDWPGRRPKHMLAKHTLGGESVLRRSVSQRRLASRAGAAHQRQGFAAPCRHEGGST